QISSSKYSFYAAEQRYFFSTSLFFYIAYSRKDQNGNSNGNIARDAESCLPAVGSQKMCSQLVGNGQSQRRTHQQDAKGDAPVFLFKIFTDDFGTARHNYPCTQSSDNAKCKPLAVGGNKRHSYES